MRKKSHGGVIGVIFAIILAAVLVLTCCIGSSWFTNTDIATWFNGWARAYSLQKMKRLLMRVLMFPTVWLFLRFLQWDLN